MSETLKSPPNYEPSETGEGRPGGIKDQAEASPLDIEGRQRGDATKRDRAQTLQDALDLWRDGIKLLLHAGTCPNHTRLARHMETYLAANGIGPKRLGKTIGSGPLDFAEITGLTPGWHDTLRERKRCDALDTLIEKFFPDLVRSDLANALRAADTEYAPRYERDQETRSPRNDRDRLLYVIRCNGGMPSHQVLRKTYQVKTTFRNASSRQRQGRS